MAVHAESSIQLNTIPAYTSLLGGHFVYRANGTTSTPPSANVIHGLGSSFNSSNPLTWGYNTHIGANGIKLRYNEIDLSAWTNNGLIFYKPPTVTAGVMQRGDMAAQLTTTGLNIIEGSITLGNKFQVTSDGTLSATDVDITGSIEATEFYVGDQNSYISYNPQTGLQINASNTANERTLEYIERIVGFSNWINEYVTFEPTEDTSVIGGKPYFIQYDIYEHYNDEENFYIYVDKTHMEENEWEELINSIKILYTIEGTEVTQPLDEDMNKYYFKENNIYIHALDYSNYVLSTDTVVNNSKSYYTRSGEEPYTYELVENPTGNPSANNYYELHTQPSDARYYTVTAQIANEPSKTDSRVYYQASTSIYVIEVEQVEHPTIDDIHLYYEPTDSGAYSPVDEPSGNPSEQEYYEKINNEYVLSADTEVDETKTYYVYIFYYKKTTDITADLNKTYFIITSSDLVDTSDLHIHYKRDTNIIRAKEEDIDFSGPQIYYEIETIDTALSPYTTNHLVVDSGGINIYDDSNTYGIRISSQGVYILSPEGIPVVSYGEDITFDDNREFTIGNNNNYIKFYKDENSDASNKIIIKADTIVFGEDSTLSKEINNLSTEIAANDTEIAKTNSDFEAQNIQNEAQFTAINSANIQQASQLKDITDKLKFNEGYVSIDSSIPSITVGANLNVETSTNKSTSAVIIVPNQVSLAVDNKTVAYLSQEKLYATSAVVTNLFMNTTDASSGTEKGGIGWVMRSNGHLSLKSM